MTGEQSAASGTPSSMSAAPGTAPTEAEHDPSNTATGHLVSDVAVNNVIDLTEESEAESKARALRVGLVEYQAQRIIKQEEVDDSTLQETESEYTEDSDDEPADSDGALESRAPRKKNEARTHQSRPMEMPETMADAQDMMGMVLSEQSILLRRKDRQELRIGDAARLLELDKQVAALDERLQQLMRAEQGDSDEVGIKVEETGAGTLGTSPAVPAGTKRKRNTGSQYKAGPAQKKVARRTGASTAPKGGRRGNAAKETLDLILGMLQTGDCITAGQEMADLPLLQGVKARTVDAQKQQLRELALTCSGADRKQIQGDNIMIAKARSALARRYKAADENFLLRGMRTALLPYQFAAVGWMVKRETEKSDELAGGGLLADNVGLGKTVEALACICGNPPSEEDVRAGRTVTLVVAPTNAVQQWLGEISRHCLATSGWRYKRSDGIDVDALTHHAVWVTSYDELLMHFPRDDAVRAAEGDNSLTAAECDGLRSKYYGPLFRRPFRRVILDECHEIKNRRSRRSKACLELVTEYRWLLSGTPIQNRLGEAFPYMRFLKAPFTSSFTEFRKAYLETPTELSELLQKVMMKRGMNTKFLGHALFELPRAHALDPVMVDLSREETIIYRKVEDVIREQVSADLRNNRVDIAQTRSWMVFVICLRQAVAHPYLLENLMKRVFKLSHVKELIEELREIQTKTPFIQQIGRWCEETLQLASAAGAEDMEGLAAEFDLVPGLEQMTKLREAVEHGLCRKCGTLPDYDAFRPQCGHRLCSECLEYVLVEWNVGNRDKDCMDCYRLIGNVQASRALWASQPDSHSSQPGPVMTPTYPPIRRQRIAGIVLRNRGDDVNGIQPRSVKTSTFLAGSDQDLSASLLPSAKTIVIKDIILDWRRRYPGDKVILFTEFIGMGRVLGRMLQDADVGFLYYFGSMSHSEKTKAITDFAANPNIHVLVGSIRCCGQALNLTAANRVIVMDHWWNSCNDQQAFGRVHRMGQHKETYFARILARNTIDERLVQIQRDKLLVIGDAVKEHDSSRASITGEEIASLFGRVVRDAEGRVVGIERDYRDEEDGEGEEEDGDDGDEEEEEEEEDDEEEGQEGDGETMEVEHHDAQGWDGLE